jgi:hypothetical protein
MLFSLGEILDGQLRCPGEPCDPLSLPNKFLDISMWSEAWDDILNTRGVVSVSKMDHTIIPSTFIHSFIQKTHNIDRKYLQTISHFLFLRTPFTEDTAVIGMKLVYPIEPLHHPHTHTQKVVQVTLQQTTITAWYLEHSN